MHTKACIFVSSLCVSVVLCTRAFSAVVCVHLSNSFRLWDVAQTPPALSCSCVQCQPYTEQTLHPPPPTPLSVAHPHSVTHFHSVVVPTWCWSLAQWHASPIWWCACPYCMHECFCPAIDKWSQSWLTAATYWLCVCV